MLDQPFPVAGGYGDATGVRASLISHFASRYVGLDESESRTAANRLLCAMARSALKAPDPDAYLSSVISDTLNTGTCLSFAPDRYVITAVPELAGKEMRSSVLGAVGRQLSSDQVMGLLPKNARVGRSGDPMKTFITLKHLLGLRQVVERTGATRLDRVGYSPDLLMAIGSPREFTVNPGTFTHDRAAFDASQDMLEAYSADTAARVSELTAGLRD